MKSLFIVFVFFTCTAFLLYSTHCSAQHSTFSVGIKGGFGVSVPDPHASLDIRGQSYALRTHGFYSGGILVQYILGNKLGIETGILNTYQSYSRKDMNGSYLLQSLGWDANIGVNSYQIPIQVMYLLRAGFNPNIRIKLMAGIAMDWHSENNLKKQEYPSMIPSILLGVRLKDRLGRYGRLEYGLEYQCSPYGEYTFEVHTDQGKNTLHTKYSVLSFNLYYFFFNREK